MKKSFPALSMERLSVGGLADMSDSRLVHHALKIDDNLCLVPFIKVGHDQSLCTSASARTPSDASRVANHSAVDLLSTRCSQEPHPPTYTLGKR